MTARRTSFLTAAAAALLIAAPPSTAANADGTADAALTETIAALDTKLFDAYNACDLATFRTLFVPDVEFFHDQGGATFDRETVIANTQKNICGKVRRELIPGTLKIYPVKGYGAIEEGDHRFCSLATGECEGAAKFLMIWQQNADGWRLTRIVSYAHRALTEAEKAALAKKKS
ncbi:MAG TPA: nuclear transport factor 2 family protein [Tahibacter sp.]|uniref:nuclear transport factor 2 family protein n=1 Tax=Tahibacter sp. TaxID=2056211 RepID=UPI002BC7520C|nr:nuclear transport factor 2 family protein [Tahibacter sp.]HSX59444.1 nuclear transport factor 2 family protein [Tahibacter sp.]